MGGGMPFGNPYEGHQAIDPTLMQQVNDFTDDPEALRRRMANMMHY